MKHWIKDKWARFRKWIIITVIGTAFAVPLAFLPTPAYFPITDYKFWYIMRNDNGQITEAAVRFYEGAITTLPEKKIIGNAEVIVDVTRYRRAKRLMIADMPERAGSAVKKESSGAETVVYTKKDFGVISTDDELRLFLNGELVKDSVRTPVAEQTGNIMK